MLVLKNTSLFNHSILAYAPVAPLPNEVVLGISNVLVSDKLFSLFTYDSCTSACETCFNFEALVH